MGKSIFLSFMKWGMIKIIKGGGQIPQQLPSLRKSERVGQVGFFLAQVRGRCRSEASEKEIKESSNIRYAVVLPRQCGAIQRRRKPT